MSDIARRFSTVIQRNTSDTRRYAEMEALTGIPATSWNKAYNWKQRPTVEMLQAVGRLWPEYAYWLLTGTTDAKHGHVACQAESTQVYPERNFGPRNAARAYFLHVLEMFNRTYGDGHQYPDEVSEKEAHVRLSQLEMARDAEWRFMDEGNPSVEGMKRAQQALYAAEDRAMAIERKDLKSLGNESN